MLDYGARSRCCKAPIRLGFKKYKLANIKRQVWICTKCRRSDVDIISNNESQDNKEFSEDTERYE
jgi:hypothetical protein